MPKKKIRAKEEGVRQKKEYLKPRLRGIQMGVHAIMGKDESAWCAYHGLYRYHAENCHQLKKEIEMLIQIGRLLSYVKYVGG